MSDNKEKTSKVTSEQQEDSPKKEVEEITVEQKLKETEDKLLRSLAEIEN